MNPTSMFHQENGKRCKKYSDDDWRNAYIIDDYNRPSGRKTLMIQSNPYSYFPWHKACGICVSRQIATVEPDNFVYGQIGIR